jgi:hypothetical protein
MHERDLRLGDLFATARSQDAHAVTRDHLGAITDALLALARRRDLFTLDEFPLPAGRRSILYVLGEDGASGCVLYGCRATPRDERPSPLPHNHATWAAVATVYGDEHQEIFERTDDRSREGWGTLRKVRELTVTPGTVVGYLPDDFHSVAMVGADPVLSLHFYGQALDSITQRIVFPGPQGGEYSPYLMDRRSFATLPAPSPSA